MGASDTAVNSKGLTCRQLLLPSVSEGATGPSKKEALSRSVELPKIQGSSGVQYGLDPRPVGKQGAGERRQRGGSVGNKMQRMGGGGAGPTLGLQQYEPTPYERMYVNVGPGQVSIHSEQNSPHPPPHALPRARFATIQTFFQCWAWRGVH